MKVKITCRDQEDKKFVKAFGAGGSVVELPDDTAEAFAMLESHGRFVISGATESIEGFKYAIEFQPDYD